MACKLLAGKRGIISGALNQDSIAWKVAQRCHQEGATFVLTNAPLAMRLGEINALATETSSLVIPADATSIEELTKLFEGATAHLGGKIDFVLHSIGMSPNIRKGKHYGELNYEWFQKTLDVSALSLHKMLAVAEKLDALNEWGSVVALSYIAAQRVFPDYTDMAQAKAMLESIARSYGYRLGKQKHVRVNTVSQSPTKTTAGAGIEGFDVMYNYADAMAPLGNASADACADYCVSLFSDLTRYVTMQNLMHDGGFGHVGISEGLVEMLTPKSA
ncbi:MAG: SDR family oxidoreductase [Hymenobacteraceae bacterium]|nr:SDR family oxidoreductase [Hymenobacteraceae bacterium]